MRVLKLILLFLWMAIIFLFSNQSATESTSVSTGLIDTMTKVILPKYDSSKIKEKFVDKYTYIVRKSAHFTEYVILGFLVYINLKESNLCIKTIILISVLFCALYSISDEFYQYIMHNGRSGQVTDCVLDAAGG